MEYKNKKMKNNMITDYNHNKLSKIKELNSDMTITNKSSDEYTNTIMNITTNSYKRSV